MDAGFRSDPSWQHIAIDRLANAGQQKEIYMLRKIASCLLTDKQKARIRLATLMGYYKEALKRNSTEKEMGLLIGTPIHGNLGDHMITVAEESFLERIGFKGEIIEIPTEAFLIFKDELKNKVGENTTIFINGGGWMGNVWPYEQRVINEIIDSFKESRIIIFPQTVYFDDGMSNYNDTIEQMRVRFSKARNLTIFVRERRSLSVMRDNFPDVKAILVPDIVFSYEPHIIRANTASDTKSAGICFREDRERVDNPLKDLIYEILRKHCIEMGKVSTVTNVRVDFRNREEILTNTFKSFLSHDVIVTDRLHGMIFAERLGIPCLVFDNATRKISSTYDSWLRNHPGILLITDETDEVVINSFLEDSKKYFPSKLDFEALKEAICGRN